jgi:hypothetical protein
MVEFKVELKGVKEALALFDPNKVRLAANNAINRVSTTARKKAADIIVQDYNIKPAKLRAFLKIAFKASGYRSYAEITGEARGISLRYFNPKQEGVRGLSGKNRKVSFSRGRRYGGQVTAQIRKGGARSVIKEIRGKGVTYPNKPFVTRNAEGIPVVWVRKGKERFPVSEGMGPGVALLFGSKRIMDQVKRVVNDRFDAEFKHQLDYYLGRLG